MSAYVVDPGPSNVHRPVDSGHRRLSIQERRATTSGPANVGPDVVFLDRKEE